MDVEHAELQVRWTAVLPAAPELAGPLLDRWSEPHRRYHTVRHLAAVLDRIAALAEPYHDRQLVELAAWYHDAVYRVPADPPGNEEASARLAEHELAGHLAAERAREVGRLVRVTVDHRVADDDLDAALLCDADLAILAAEPHRYAAYVEEIRAEYGHIPDAQFRRGRREVLIALLDQEPLFRTPRGSRLASAARRNLTAEIAQLR